MVPHRLVWAVDQLGLDLADRVLEVGCGTGKAAAPICASLAAGGYVGIDRSERAIRWAVAHNAAHVSSGRAVFRCVSLEHLLVVDVRPVTKVLAVNVNLFWVRAAHIELALLRDVLAPGGSVLLAYENPTSDTSRAERLLLRNVSQAGFHSEIVRPPDIAGLFAIRARVT